MNIVMAFTALMGVWIALLGSHVVLCLALYAYRAHWWPPLGPLLPLTVGGLFFWLAPQQPEAISAMAFLVGAGLFAFIAGGMASSELRSLNPDPRSK